MSDKAKLKGALSDIDRELVTVSDEAAETRNFLEALHMMAMDLESTPPEEAKPAFRAVAQSAIDRCEAVIEAAQRAKELAHGA